MKLWTGRLSGEVDEKVNALNASIAFDARMVKQDVTGSMAHAKMLCAIGVLSPGENAAIQDGLASILADLSTGALAVDPGAEDVHTFVEAELTKRIGPPGKMLHTARSRNDQVALDLRMYLLDAIDEIHAKAGAAAAALMEVSQAHTETVMPGYTHLQRAQPVTLAHHLMAYVWMLLRDMERLRECRRRTAVLPLGSGALAGTTYPLDRRMVCDELGFAALSENSMDGVSDRDFVLELSCVLSMLMMHLSRLSEELVLWSSLEFRFISLPDSFSTGSSIMPQKKNPDIPELIRGKTGRVYGHMSALFTLLKALPLAYNKDLQEDKEAIFDAVDTVGLCLEVLPDMLKNTQFHKERMADAASRGFLNATDCADYLVKKGMPFRDAYKLSGQLVNRCISLNCTLETLPLAEYQGLSPLFDGDVYAAIDLLNCVNGRNVYGGPAPEQVNRQIALAKERLGL